jgi:hypothetical protein
MLSKKYMKYQGALSQLRKSVKQNQVIVMNCEIPIHISNVLRHISQLQTNNFGKKIQFEKII